MNHRIRSAAIIIDNQKRILLVKHVHPEKGHVWWVPPGGSLEGDEDIFLNAKRETFEETNLDIELDKIIYIREFVDNYNNNHNLEVYIKAKSYKGEISIKNVKKNDLDYCWIKDVGFFNINDLKDKEVFPEIIKTPEFWNDYNNNFPNVKYLGKQVF